MPPCPRGQDSSGAGWTRCPFPGVCSPADEAVHTQRGTRQAGKRVQPDDVVEGARAGCGFGRRVTGTPLRTFQQQFEHDRESALESSRETPGGQNGRVFPEREQRFLKISAGTRRGGVCGSETGLPCRSLVSTGAGAEASGALGRTQRRAGAGGMPPPNRRGESSPAERGRTRVRAEGNAARRPVLLVSITPCRPNCMFL